MLDLERDFALRLVPVGVLVVESTESERLCLGWGPGNLETTCRSCIVGLVRHYLLRRVYSASPLLFSSSTLNLSSRRTGIAAHLFIGCRTLCFIILTVRNSLRSTKHV